ncbi:46 kDa FK506-binding nuclear protein-like [Daphnia carinata]|uniref:46 kDa FK506-binding nuclear protein-like n=1 Tax=Daphnia carinata TaxID=120202 RepID=UPI0025804758|nr:46 kDa FK506-binding nuclear protein-like [Daphnia carinata]
MQACPNDRSFWGMVIQPGVKHSFTVERPLHISKAVIDLRSWGTERPAATSLLVDIGDHKEIILCNLDMHSHFGCGQEHHKSLKSEADLDLHFKAGENIAFFSAKHCRFETSNNFKEAVIHLSGYQL